MHFKGVERTWGILPLNEVRYFHGKSRETEAHTWNSALIIRMYFFFFSAPQAETIWLRDSTRGVWACSVLLSYQVLACTNLPTLHENSPPSFFQNSWLLFWTIHPSLSQTPIPNSRRLLKFLTVWLIFLSTLLPHPRTQHLRLLLWLEPCATLLGQSPIPAWLHCFHPWENSPEEMVFILRWNTFTWAAPPDLGSICTLEILHILNTNKYI